MLFIIALFVAVWFGTLSIDGMVEEYSGNGGRILIFAVAVTYVLLHLHK